MSSFVIDKIQYMKAAGLMYGIEECKRDKHHYFLEVCRERFSLAYALNVTSVAEQYGDTPVMDMNTYDEEFERHRKLAHGIYERDCMGIQQPLHMRDLCPRLMNFFQSVLYQIENEASHRIVAAWFYSCVIKLYESDIRRIDGWWGDVELMDEIKKAV
jgi:hypothetical protein